MERLSKRDVLKFLDVHGTDAGSDGPQARLDDRQMTAVALQIGKWEQVLYGKGIKTPKQHKDYCIIERRIRTGRSILRESMGVRGRCSSDEKVRSFILAVNCSE